MKWILSLIFIVLFSSFVVANTSTHYIHNSPMITYPHFVSVYNIGKVSLLSNEKVDINYTLKNKYDVLYHVSGYESVENCGVRFLKSGFGNNGMVFYGRECIEFDKPDERSKFFGVRLI